MLLLLLDIVRLTRTTVSCLLLADPDGRRVGRRVTTDQARPKRDNEKSEIDGNSPNMLASITSLAPRVRAYVTRKRP